ncbi:MAG: hypothetical protein WD004_04235 [Actinomycetota bacterium]
MPDVSERIPKGVHKDYLPVLRAARSQGFRFAKARGGHPLCYPPDGLTRPIPIPTTPGNPKLLHGFIAQLRRAGLEWPSVRERRNRR